MDKGAALMWSESMNHPQLNQIRTQWANTDPILRNLLQPINNAEQHTFTLAVFEQLMTEIDQPDADAATLELYHLLGEHLHAYEQLSPLPPAEPREIVRFLMDQHDLKQSDLPEIGSQGVVSEVLSGKRVLNLRQARALAERFGVDAAVFLATPAT
jgi:HTH-type transcriptional regulator/antitoxin HigA